MSQGVLKKSWSQFKEFFIEQSGGKKTVSIARVGVAASLFVMISAVAAAWLSPGEDFTFYTQSSTPLKGDGVDSQASSIPQAGVMAGFFANGQKKMASEKRAEAERNKHRVAIKYFAPQVIGVGRKGPKAIQMGSKLVGFLMSPIDTRAQALVRVVLPQGGEASGIEIEKGSILIGRFSYSGSDDKVLISFSRLNTPDGDMKQIAAQALDAADYNVGIRGEAYTGNGIKIASRVGLTMLSGMADVLTEKESLGFSMNGVQAKPTMKNALLQGTSRAAQDEVNRTASDISSVEPYVLIPEGKEMIIELTEDFRK